MSSGADWAPSNPFHASNHACRDRSASRRWTRAGFTRSSTRLRILAHRRGYSVRLFSRNGYNFADRFSFAAAAIESLPVRSCVVDGEAIVCDGSGLAVFDLCAFDQLEVNGEDIRREPIEDRKRRLAGLLRLPHDGIALNETSPVRARRSTRLRARMRGHRFETDGIAVACQTVGALAEGEEPGGAGR